MAPGISGHEGTSDPSGAGVLSPTGTRDEGEGYRLFALEEDGEILAVTGVTIRTTLYYGKHLFIHDLVTRADRRSRGCGERLLSYVEEWGRSRGCGSVALTSGLARRDAHRFYEERMGYDRVSHVFRKIF